jgi:hypothetical protein
VPVPAKLGSEIKRFVARPRPEVGYPSLLINREGKPYGRFGIDEMMDRLQESVGFWVYAHGFRPPLPRSPPSWVGTWNGCAPLWRDREFNSMNFVDVEER